MGLTCCRPEDDDDERKPLKPSSSSNGPLYSAGTTKPVSGAAGSSVVVQAPRDRMDSEKLQTKHSQRANVSHLQVDDVVVRTDNKEECMLSPPVPPVLDDPETHSHSSAIEQILVRAAHKVAWQMHCQWRKDYMKQLDSLGDGYKPRMKKVDPKDKQWRKLNLQQDASFSELPRGVFRAGNTLEGEQYEVDIAAVDRLDALPSQIRVSILDSAQFAQQDAVKEVRERKRVDRPTADDIKELLDDVTYLLAVGDRMHDHWLCNNNWAKDGSMDVSFRCLSSAEARKDITVAVQAIQALRQELGGEEDAVEPIVDNVMTKFEDVSQSREAVQSESRLACIQRRKKASGSWLAIHLAITHKSHAHPLVAARSHMNLAVHDAVHDASSSE